MTLPDFHKTVNLYDSPLDLFVTEAEDLLDSFEQLLNKNWTQTSLRSIALWCPNIEHEFNIGTDFALAFEPQFIVDEILIRELMETRKKFVEKHGIKKIINDLSKHIFYTEQLLSNEYIIKNITEKLLYWKCIEG